MELNTASVWHAERAKERAPSGEENSPLVFVLGECLVGTALKVAVSNQARCPWRPDHRRAVPGRSPLFGVRRASRFPWWRDFFPCCLRLGNSALILREISAVAPIRVAKRRIFPVDSQLSWEFTRPYGDQLVDVA
jgi:hypothetical protein